MYTNDTPTIFCTLSRRHAVDYKNNYNDLVTLVDTLQKTG
jgi:hypothetical protein